MENNILAVKGLTKSYKDFILDDVSFHVPRGSIVGLIGENGAGKTTIINAILGIIRKDAGEISMLGKRDDHIDNEVRNKIGVVFDGNNFSETLSPDKLNHVFKNTYADWDQSRYYALLKQFSLPADKKVKDLSKGMKMKLSIAVALSHHSRLLLLDEATSGLDPIVREDILDILLDFVQDEENSILVSSHITSDLEKVADYIVFIHNGKVVFQKPKDELKYSYGILRCGAAQFEAIDKDDVVVYRKKDYALDILVKDKAAMQKKYPNAVIDSATIDEIMLLYVKGEK